MSTDSSEKNQVAILRSGLAIAASSASGPDLDLIKDIAMDIGKEVIAYIEVMYPQAITAKRLR